MTVRFGALYYPCWTGQARSNSQWYTNNELSPALYQTRAPWFSQQLSEHTTYINATQAHIDQDCIYARDGGIKYFMFQWFGVAGQAGDGTNSLQGEFKLYQASPNKGLVNWCLNIGMQAFLAYVNTDLAKLVAYVKQSNYETVLGSRPLIYFGHNESVSTSTGVAAAVTAFRAACASNGVGDPYIVVMNFDGPTAAAAMTAVGAQAITTYSRAYSGASRKTFASYIADQQSQWENHWKPTGVPLVPNVTSGWNTSPIRARGEFNSSYARGGVEARMYDHVVPATPAELVTLATAVKTFMAANAAQCPANTAIWYAWSEHTEGGYLRPLWSASGPNKSRLDALVTVHNS
jgi:hypothetical protein